MKKQQLILLGQLKEAINSKEPFKQNKCRGLIQAIIDLETEQPDSNPEGDK